jgi:proteasome accessory factor C
LTSDRTVSRLARILALIPYVLERGSVDVEDVIDRFGYSPAQLSRDLDTVFVCGLPGYGPGDLMEAFIDEDEVIIDAADYFTRAPRLTPVEALGLMAAGMAVVGTGQGTPALESAVRKLGRVVAPEGSPAIAVDVLDETSLVEELRLAAAEERVVRITYRSVGKEETTVRDVEPWTVFNTTGRWYLSGHCRLVGGERTFRVDRIRSIEDAGERFERPKSVPAPVIGYTPGEGDISCVIDLDPKAHWVTEYYPVEVIGTDAGGARIRFFAPDPEVPARLLLRLGGLGRLVEGDEVAERVKTLGTALLSAHS